jgi:hypothetical protein
MILASVRLLTSEHVQVCYVTGFDYWLAADQG